MMSKKQNNRKNNKSDWKTQLATLKAEMELNMTSEEKEEREQKELEAQTRLREINKRKAELYEFLAGYKHNSGIFINNFFRNRDYETYCEDKFDGFDFDISGIVPNVFDNFNFSIAMAQYLKNLDREHIAYHPISLEYIKHLIAFAEVLDLTETTEDDTVVYRGCSTLERNGVNGLVSTTTNRKIAEQFSRGTILTIHIPKGTKYLEVKSIRPKEQIDKDLEDEIILPPCDFQILSERTVERGREPNNCKGVTKLIELTVSPLDLLEEFLHMLENPPLEYDIIRELSPEMYDEAIAYLKGYLSKRPKKAQNILKKSINKESNSNN